MDINDLTIGQARELLALLGRNGGAAPVPPPHQVLVGRHVVVRSSLSGVWLGRLDVATAPSGVTLSGARRAWSWTGAGSCSALALKGPSGGKIEAPVEVVVISETVEVIAATTDAVAAWARVSPWAA